MSELPYDPTTDPDTDPGSLNPRTGGEAADKHPDEAGADPDADPEMLNPRDETGGTTGLESEADDS